MRVLHLGCLPLACKPVAQMAPWQRVSAPAAVDLTRKPGSSGACSGPGPRRHASPRQRAADLATRAAGEHAQGPWAVMPRTAGGLAAELVLDLSSPWGCARPCSPACVRLGV